MSARKDLIETEITQNKQRNGLVFGGLVISIVLAVLSPLASSHPDGLEWVAEQSGFLNIARDAFYSVIPDYSLPGINNPALATIAAGIIGVLLIFAILYGWGKYRSNISKNEISQG